MDSVNDMRIKSVKGKTIYLHDEYVKARKRRDKGLKRYAPHVSSKVYVYCQSR